MMLLFLMSVHCAVMPNAFLNRSPKSEHGLRGCIAVSCIITDTQLNPQCKTTVRSVDALTSGPSCLFLVLTGLNISGEMYSPGKKSLRILNSNFM